MQLGETRRLKGEPVLVTSDRRRLVQQNSQVSVGQMLVVRPRGEAVKIPSLCEVRRLEIQAVGQYAYSRQDRYLGSVNIQIECMKGYGITSAARRLLVPPPPLPQ